MLLIKLVLHIQLVGSTLIGSTSLFELDCSFGYENSLFLSLSLWSLLEACLECENVFIVTKLSVFLKIALLNLITISSTWARVIDVMDSEVRFLPEELDENCNFLWNAFNCSLFSQVPDYLDLLGLEPHLDSFAGPCLQPEWLSWGHVCLFIQSLWISYPLSMMDFKPWIGVLQFCYCFLLCWWSLLHSHQKG